LALLEIVLFFSLDSQNLNPNCNTGISFHSVMQNIFITFEAESPQDLYTQNPFHFHERGDIQYFIDLQTIIRAKRDCKITKIYLHIQKTTSK
jgi:hypothetical protein